MLSVIDVNQILQTSKFSKWLLGLADLRARAKISIRLQRAGNGHFGDVRFLGDSIWEMRIDYGPGYRIYYAQEGGISYLLLTGGDKSDQRADISTAKRMWRALNSRSGRID